MSSDEYQAKREWLRLNPHGSRAHVVRRELRAWDRELTSQGVTVEEWLELRARRTSSGGR